MNKKIKIAIVDDHPMISHCLKTILLHDPCNEVVDIFISGAQILDYTTTKKVDIIFLDVGLPDASGIEICREIKKNNPETLIIILTNRSERSLILQSIQNGASGYLLKSADIEEISDSIRSILQGNIVYSKEIKNIISRPSLVELEGVPRLTKREIEIIKMIEKGKTTLEIAETLSLSPFTVNAHRRNLMQKFDAKNTIEMIMLAKKYNII